MLLVDLLCWLSLNFYFLFSVPCVLLLIRTNRKTDKKERERDAMELRAGAAHQGSAKKERKERELGTAASFVMSAA